MVIARLQIDLKGAAFLQHIVCKVSTCVGYDNPNYKVLCRYFIEKSQISVNIADVSALFLTNTWPIKNSNG